MTAKKEKWKDRSRIVNTNASFHAFRPDSAIRGEKKVLQSGHTGSMALNHRHFFSRG